MQTSSRRSFMSSAVAVAAASMPGCSFTSPAAASFIKAAPYVPAPDPLAELIAEYRSQTAAFNVLAGSDDDDGEAWAKLVDKTYGPSFDHLRERPPVPTTYAGALAGIEFVRDELAAHLDSDANEAVLRACATFLRSFDGAAS